MSHPLAVRWRAHELPTLRAGALSTARVEVENVGSTPWRDDRFTVSYHWLDERRNPIVWDGLRTPVRAEPGEAVTVDVRIRSPIPPGRYLLSIDVVDEGRFWFGEVGSTTLDVDVAVAPRIDDPGEARAELGDAIREPDWGERVFAAHREGYAVVGGSVRVPAGVFRQRPAALKPYEPGTGRVPGFAHPIVCASVVDGVEVEWVEVEGLPAAVAPPDEPVLYDGRITVRLPSGRRRG
jgi:hypothetical protein